MDAQRSNILNQLADGTLSAEQAAEQLRGGARPQVGLGAPATPEQKAAMTGRWLRVRVTDIASGQPKVTVNVPLMWVALGLRLGARYAPEVADLNLNGLLDTLPAEASGPLIDVEDMDDGERVQIFID